MFSSFLLSHYLSPSLCFYEDAPIPTHLLPPQHPGIPLQSDGQTPFSLCWGYLLEGDKTAFLDKSLDSEH